MINPPPVQTAVDATGTKVAVQWVQWFQTLYSFLGTEATWTPAFTGLTVAPGTGTVTYSGTYTKIGRAVFWVANITITGNATTASTVNTTQITNLPVTVGASNTCVAVNAATTSYGNGLVAAAGTVALLPTWAAYNGNVVITGWYST